MPKVCFLETEFFKKDLWRYKMIKYAHGYKYEKKMNCMFSLYNESKMKREENAFLQLYIVTCNKKIS